MLRWVVNRDEALVLHRDGKPVGGIWRGAWKTGKRHVPNQKAAAALAVAGALSGMSFPIGPYDIIEHGFLAAFWDPYRRVGRFLTVKEAKAEMENSK